MFYSGKNYAALNPIAEAVKKKHELKIEFPAYNLFKNTNTNVNENIKKNNAKYKTSDAFINNIRIRRKYALIAY